MKQIHVFFILFLIISFVLGIMVCLSYSPIMDISSINEPMENKENSNSVPPESSCPNILLKKDNYLQLYNSYIPISDTNPIRFNNLDEYIDYVNKQREQGYTCPVLYLQQENNAQGQDVYRIRPSPLSVQGGLPTVTDLPRKPVPVADASRDSKIYNKGNYPGFDSHYQYNGIYTNLDQIHDSTENAPISDNPMDTNWGGVIHSQQMIDSGKYNENTVGKPLMVPKMTIA